MSSDSSDKLNELLLPGERLIWQGRPGQGIRFRSMDFYAIPFSLLWFGFVFFWQWSVLQNPNSLYIAQLCGIPFVVLGLYFVFGRFIWDAYVRSRQVYVLTNKRVFVANNHKTNAFSLSNLPELTLTSKASGEGTIGFAGTNYFTQRGANPFAPSSAGNSFEFLSDAKSVFRMINDAQSKLASS